MRCGKNIYRHESIKIALNDLTETNCQTQLKLYTLTLKKNYLGLEYSTKKTQRILYHFTYQISILPMTLSLYNSKDNYNNQYYICQMIISSDKQ